MRGSSREPGGAALIEAAGIEAAVADPRRPGTVLDLVGDITAVHWLLGSAAGEADAVGALHGESLAALLEKLIDTPVRGFVYEAAGALPDADLDRGAGLVLRAARTWCIPVEVVRTDPSDFNAWLEAMSAATERIVS